MDKSRMNQPDQLDLKQKRRIFVALAIAFVPIAADWIYKVFLSVRPLWAFHYDPEMPHFYASLQILSGQSPEETHTPGTPLQVLGALIALFSGPSPLNADSFRLGGYIIAFVMILVAAFFLIRTLAKGQPLTLQASLIWIFFIAPTSLLYLNIWSPELLCFPFGALAVIAIWYAFSRPASAGKTVFAGAAVGLCIALKFTFLSWVPAFLIALVFRFKGDSGSLKKQFLYGCAGIVTGFFAGTLPILPRYSSQFRWMLAMVTHSGPYGSGKQSFPTSGELLLNLNKLVGPALDWHVCIFILIVTMVFVIFRRGKSLDKGVYSMALFAIVGHISTFLQAFAARSVSVRYLLPAGLTGLVLFALTLMTVQANGRRILSMPVFLIMGFLVLKNSVVDMAMNDRRIEEQLMLRHEIEASLDRQDNAWRQSAVIFGWRLPEPSLALRINTYQERDWKLISARYPREGHMSLEGEIHLPEGSSRWDYMVLRSDYTHFLSPRPGQVVDCVGEYFVIKANGGK